METSVRGRTPLAEPAAPGAFRPGVPRDSHGVMLLFAIAARRVCAAPQTLEDCQATLEAIAARLTAPEATAAAECQRLWALFARVAQLPKHSLRLEAGRAFCRDLDAIGQRLDLPPLDDWERLPDALDEPGAVEAPLLTRTDEWVTLAAVREAAREIAGREPQAKVFPAAEAARLISTLNSGERRQLFEHMVGRGLLGRGDVNLLARFLVKGDAPGPQDTMLVEVLRRLGAYLAAPPR